MTLIKIDGRTIKKYKCYTGSYQNYKIVLRAHPKRLDFLEAKLKEISQSFWSVGFNVIVSSPDYCEIEIDCVDKKAFTKFKNLKKLKGVGIVSMTIVDNIPRETIEYIKRLPEWEYDYLPTKVKCKHCGAEFPWTEIETCYPDEHGFYRVDGVCPKCAEGDCCEYEFETMDGYLARKGKAKIWDKFYNLVGR